MENIFRVENNVNLNDDKINSVYIKMKIFKK